MAARTTTLEPKVVDIHAGAKAYGLSAKRIKAAINCGALPGKRDSDAANAKYLVRVADLDAFVESLPDA